MIDNGPTNMLTESERLNLVIEAYSSEPGMGFQEHYLIDSGEIVIEDEVDYSENYAPDLSLEEKIEIAEEHNVTVEELENMVNDDGDICFGGYGDDFANFEDLFVRLNAHSNSEKKIPLDEQLSNAQKRAAEQLQNQNQSVNKEL